MKIEIVFYHLSMFKIFIHNIFANQSDYKYLDSIPNHLMMHEKHNRPFYDVLENQLAEITLSGEPLTEQYKASIKVCKKAMNKLKNYVSSYAFKSVAEEVIFFKVI